jgi:hypothetical protein
LNDLTIDFGGNVNTPDLKYSTCTSGILVEFTTLQTIPEGKYKVKVFATFEESAI